MVQLQSSFWNVHVPKPELKSYVTFGKGRKMGRRWSVFQIGINLWRFQVQNRVETYSAIERCVSCYFWFHQRVCKQMLSAKWSIILKIEAMGVNVLKPTEIILVLVSSIMSQAEY